MEPIDVGFKYLGYRFKPLGYGINDWRWIIKNFEKRISLLSYILLSLGGRLLLIQVVLTGIPVYWFALARVPKSLLNSLRQCMLSFLWGSTDGRIRMHLVDWHTISMPLDYRGWNIKKLDWLCTSLRLKSLWMVLKGSGIWNKIISRKYLKDLSLDHWL